MDEPRAYSLADAVAIRAAVAGWLMSDTLEELAGLEERRDALARQIAELLEERLELEMELTNTKQAREG